MHPPEDPDRAVVERAQRGDDRAYDELMARYQQPVLHFVFRLLGGSPDAEDVAQEAFVRAYLNLGRFRFRPGARFSTWLFQVARNAALDHVRKRRRRPQAAPDPARAEPADASPDAAAALMHRETGAAIERAFAALPEDQRTALVLAEYHGCGADEIAAVMKSSVRAAESRLFRARRQVRQALAHLRPG